MKPPARARLRTPAGFDPLPWLVIIAGAVAGAAVYWRSLHYGLAQDAFTLLARGRGLAPDPGGVWRFLSYDVYFRLMDAGFGLDPLPYRIVGLLLHAANAAMVGALALRLGLSPPAGFAAAMFFAAHNASFEALFAVAGVGEPMAATFILLALLFAAPPEGHRAGRLRGLAATAAFAAALLSKETVVLFPLVLWVIGRLRPEAARRALWPCVAMSLLYLVLFWITDPFGSLRAAGPNPYRPQWGPGVLSAWATYVAWSFHLLQLFQADLGDRVASHPEGWWVTAALIAMLVATALRARKDEAANRPWIAGATGAALYAAFIAPVLPLAEHAFHYYLYLPLMGLAWALAAGWDAWVPRRARAAAWLVGIWLAVQGALTVRGMETVPLRDTSLPFLGSVRRAATAARVLRGLADPSAPPPDSLVMLGPDAMTPPGGPDTTQLGAFLFNDVAGALDEGNGVRLRFPQVRRVTFYGDLGSWLGQPDVVVFDYEGNVMRGPAAWLYLRRAEATWQDGRIGATAEAMARAGEMTRLWRAQTAGPWRIEGLRGIRLQAEAMLDAERRRPAAPGDPRAAVRPAYAQALARVIELTQEP